MADIGGWSVICIFTSINFVGYVFILINNVIAGFNIQQSSHFLGMPQSKSVEGLPKSCFPFLGENPSQVQQFSFEQKLRSNTAIN